MLALGREGVHHVSHIPGKCVEPDCPGTGSSVYSGARVKGVDRLGGLSDIRSEMGAPKFTQVMKASLLKPDLMAELDRFRREITVLFTDIRGSTAYFEKHGEIDKTQGGKLIKTIGDAVMATFEDANGAVQCAVNMQKALKEHNATRL